MPTASFMRRHGRSVLMVIVGTAISFGLVRLSEAGTLAPPAAPAGTMNMLEQIWAPIASSAYDSSSVVSDENGNALQIAHCIVDRLNGVSSPDCP